MHLDRRWIEEHIPHQNSMCLLEEVLSWDSSRARCRASSHRSPSNPLRANGRLGAACGIEYAAQTMAVHGALMASVGGTTARSGFLASLRAVQLHVDRLDDVEGDLVTLVTHLAADEHSALYEFSVSSNQDVLINGRAAITFHTVAIASGDPQR